jgi:hypothetical protein
MPFKNADIWNVLHDGTIVSITEHEQTARVRVEIQYLRQYFIPAGAGFDIDLCDFAFVGYSEWSAPDKRGHNPSSFAALQPEVLSATSEPDGSVALVWNGGTAILRYSSISLHLDTGTEISVNQLTDAAAAYWDSFGQER